MSKKEKSSLEIPSWAFGAAIVVVLGIAAYFIIGRAGGGGPLPENQYPKEAYQAPGYAAPTGQQRNRDGSVAPAGAGGAASAPPGMSR